MAQSNKQNDKIGAGNKTEDIYVKQEQEQYNSADEPSTTRKSTVQR